MVTLCGRLTQISMSAHGTTTEVDIEVVKFIENSAPFSMLLGKKLDCEKSGHKIRRGILRTEEARINIFHD